MYLTYIFIGITVIVSFLAWQQPSLMKNLIMNPYQVSTRNEYYRLITSGFIHQDHMHLIFNMITLYFLGTGVEYVFKDKLGNAGGTYFILLYIVGIIVSDLPTYLKHKNNPRYNSLGASGGVAAVVFAFILFRPVDNLYIYMIKVPGFIFGSLYIIFSWYQGRKSNDNINHDAHLYGSLFGIIFCVIVYPPVIQEFLGQIQRWMN